MQSVFNGLKCVKSSVLKVSLSFTFDNHFFNEEDRVQQKIILRHFRLWDFPAGIIGLNTESPPGVAGLNPGGPNIQTSGDTLSSNCSFFLFSHPVKGDIKSCVCFRYFNHLHFYNRATNATKFQTFTADSWLLVIFWQTTHLCNQENSVKTAAQKKIYDLDWKKGCSNSIHFLKKNDQKWI